MKLFKRSPKPYELAKEDRPDLSNADFARTQSMSSFMKNVVIAFLVIFFAVIAGAMLILHYSASVN